MSRCVRCGQEDALTMVGRKYCGDCLEYFQIYNRKQREKHRDRRNQAQREKLAACREAGVCTHCRHRPAAPGRAQCRVCLAKDRRRKQTPGQSHADRLIRVELGQCYKCGRPQRPGGKLCPQCYRDALDGLAAANAKKREILQNRSHPWQQENNAGVRRWRALHGADQKTAGQAVR